MITPSKTQWPQDADGDVFRRLEADNFNFEAIHHIDFNIDFDEWPPAPKLIDHLRALYPRLEIIESDENGSGYVQFVVESKLTYELVMFVQSSVSELAAPYGGICESWGVMHER